MKTAEAIARILLKEKAVFLRPQDPFTWTSGIRSPVYCDNRLLISRTGPRSLIVKAFADEVRKFNINVIAGTATAGIPWAAWIAMELDLPLIYVRSSSKDHGRQNAIEGSVAEGSRTVLIEDLISTGKSSIAAARKLREAGIQVESILSIFSYDFPDAREAFHQAQLNHQSLSTFDVLAQVAYDDNELDTKTLNEVLEWRKSVVFP
jgi:orotate phosphoribosyltransferase